MDDLGINLTGAEVILRMAQRMTELQQRVEMLESKLKQLGAYES
jgi:BMFP domain-containing protein YqiC